MTNDAGPKSGEVIVETKAGPVKMLLTRNIQKKVASNWKPFLVALSAVGVAVLGYIAAWINTKTDELKANEDPTDKSILQLRDKVDAISSILAEHRIEETKEIAGLKTKLALAEQTISWLRKRATGSASIDPVAVVAAPLPDSTATAAPVSPDILMIKTEDIPISDEKLKTYQQSKR